MNLSIPLQPDDLSCAPTEGSSVAQPPCDDALSSLERQLQRLESSYGLSGQAHRPDTVVHDAPGLCVQPQAEPATPLAPSAPEALSVPPGTEADGVLHDVQSTLDSLAGMAQGLSRQRMDLSRVQEALEERRAIAQDRERLLSEWEERLRLQELGLHEQKLAIERAAEQNASVLAERSAALQTLAETVENRDRAAIKRADLQQQEQRNLERLSGQLHGRAHELDKRDAALQRQASELAARLKQLVDARERFGAIVKGFNETVRFNSALSSISNTVTGTVGE